MDSKDSSISFADKGQETATPSLKMLSALKTLAVMRSKRAQDDSQVINLDGQSHSLTILAV